MFVFGFQLPLLRSAFPLSNNLCKNTSVLGGAVFNNAGVRDDTIGCGLSSHTYVTSALRTQLPLNALHLLVLFRAKPLFVCVCENDNLILHQTPFHD